MAIMTVHDRGKSLVTTVLGSEWVIPRQWSSRGNHAEDRVKVERDELCRHVILGE
jgi:hypothetical protein